MQKTARQGGSTAVFVVFGIVLIVLALGSIYGVRRLAMNDQTPPLVVPEETEDAGNDQPQDTKDETDEQPEAPVIDGDTEDKPDDAPTTSTDQEAQPPVTSPTETETGSTGSTGLPSTGGGSGASNAGPEKLPQSGPEEAIMSIFAVTFISIAGLAYIKSRRALQ